MRRPCVQYLTQALKMTTGPQPRSGDRLTEDYKTRRPWMRRISTTTIATTRST